MEPLLYVVLPVLAIVLANVVRYVVSPKLGGVPRGAGEEDRGAFKVRTHTETRKSAARRELIRFGVMAIVTSHKLIIATGTSPRARVIRVVEFLGDGDVLPPGSGVKLFARRANVVAADSSSVDLDIESESRGSRKKPTPAHFRMTSPNAPNLFQALRRPA
jgi:hypothetical protein